MDSELRGIFSVLFSMLLLLGLIGNGASQVSAYSPSPSEVNTSITKPYHIYSDGTYLWIGTSDGKVYRSPDDGASWNLVLNVNNTDAVTYLLEKDSQGNLYASFSTVCDLYRSTNNGNSWSLVYDLSVYGMNIAGYMTTGGFFDMGNGTILAARRNFNSPVVDISNDWGATWSLWKNFSEIFPAYTAADPSKPYIQKMMRHTHIVYYFNGSYYVSSGDYVANHYKSSDGGSTWTVDYAGTSFTAVKVLPDRVILGVDLGNYGLFLYENGDYIKTYNPHKDVNPYVIFRNIAYDSENDIYYTAVGANPIAQQTILASLDHGESWFNFINVTNTAGFYGILQVAVHKNYLWYVMGDRTSKLPKPAQAEIINAMKGDASTFKAFSNVKSYTSLTQKAYKNAIATISNASWTNMATNPSFESFVGNTPTNWTYSAIGWSGTTSIGEETSDVYHGSKAFKIEAGLGNGTIRYYSNAFTTTEGYYYLTAMYKVNASWLQGVTKLQFYTPTLGRIYGGVRFHDINGTWQNLGVRFYLTASQASANSRIYLNIESPATYNIRVKILWDAIMLIKEDNDKHTFQPFFSDTIHSGTGSIEINGQIFSITSLPMNISLGYLTGKIYAKLTSAKVVSVTISGQVVLIATNATLLHYQNSVYLARWYPGFAFAGTENKIIIAEDTLSIISGISLSNAKLAFTVSASPGASSTTIVYCLDKGEPTTVQATNGTLTWSYNASTTILTLNIVHDGPAKVLVDWRIPGDVNGDGDVDASDLFNLSKAYGSKLGDPKWNLDCDFNWDSKIDASDLFYLSKNYERTKT